MNISLFQQDICWLEPQANYRKIEKVLQDNPDTDLLVMPEMCATGFVTIPQTGQIETAASVEARLGTLAKKYNTALCGSFAVEIAANGTNANRCYFVTPEGDLHHYDKHHLFRPGMEHKGYTAGDRQVVVEWRGLRFMLTVCFDLRFPIWNRFSADEPYDILICVANWPAARQLAWDTLIRARAIENQAYCIGVNRVGHDTMCDYQGGTCAIHPYGHAVATCPDGEESICTFTPDMEKLASYRQKFPTLADEDQFQLIIEN